jgi:hypothetical protein
MILGYCNRCDQPADSSSCVYDPHANEYVVTINHHGESATIRVPGAKVAIDRNLTVTAFDKQAA